MLGVSLERRATRGERLYLKKQMTTSGMEFFKKRQRADSAFASKQAKGLKMTLEEKAPQKEKHAGRE